ncbi:MAG TPA: hypothetical protein VH109_02695 [Steroidobacteraceae bacterium]|nr:hypothetical protein [Steroidobacteraceae bacterium]
MTTPRSARVARPLQLSIAAAAAMLAACGGGGGSSPPPPPPTASLSASAKDVAVNGSDTLTWTSTNASSCTASGGWSGSLAPSGSKSVTVASSATYTITCTGGAGSANASTSVTAWSAPQPKISADTTSLLANNTVNLTWSSTGATACTGQDALAGASVGTSGGETSPTLTATTVFSIACTNPAFSAVKASVTVTVSTTYTAVITVNYQVPGPPVVNASNFYVPDWANPVANAVPFVWVEMQDPTSHVVAQAYADANGKATLTGLNPAVIYTPVVRSKMSDPALGLDFVVLNNTAPVDTSQPAYRKRYAPYANSGPAYTADTRNGTQNLGTLTATDGWDSTQNALVDAKRFAGPYALLANAVREAQIVSAAIGGSPPWRPLTILWSVKNKGGLSAPPNETDQGYVTGVGGFYNSGHDGVDASGTETGAFVSEDFEFLSGDQTTEPMDIYPFVLTHEMGHFTQSLFSTLDSPGYEHAYTDYEDPTLAWIEGNASGIAALVLNTADQNRLIMNSGTLIVEIVDPVANTVNGHAQGWPVGWFQEATTTSLMWQLYDPNGTVHLSAPAVLAPMYSAAWKAAPWLNSPWAYAVQLAKGNAAHAAAIDALSDSLHIKATGDDEWGSTEPGTGDRTAKDALAPYTTVTIGAAPVQICSAGAPNEYNKESNVRYGRVMGDGATHTLKVQGPNGTVPVVGRGLFTPGSNVYSTSTTLPAGYVVFSVGDCSVANSPFSTDTASCSEPATPPTEQCWTVSVQ